MEAARARARKPGPPVRLTAEKIRQARQLLDAGEPNAAVARTLGVGRTTLYRHLATDAGSNEAAA